MLVALTTASDGASAAETKPDRARVNPAIRGEPILSVRTNPPNAAANPPTNPVVNVATNATSTNEPVLLTPAQILADRKTAPTLLSFETLGGFECRLFTELEPPKIYATLKLRDPIPEKIRAFNGQRVTLTGYMIPITGDGRYFHEFLLVRDMQSCCFGRAPKMNHWVRVRMTSQEPGVRQDEGRPVSVTGVLTVGEYQENGVLSAIYQLQGEKQEATLWVDEPENPEVKRIFPGRR